MTEDTVHPMKTPTADEVREIMKIQNRKVVVFALAFLLLGGASIWFSASGRAASQDSANATSAALANNSRAECISTLRRAEAAAIGEMVAALGNAQIAGFFLDAREVVLEERAHFEEAEATRSAIATKLQAENLSRPPSEGGCGPPIIDDEDIPDDN